VRDAVGGADVYLLEADAELEFVTDGGEELGFAGPGFQGFDARR